MVDSSGRRSTSTEHCIRYLEVDSLHGTLVLSARDGVEFEFSVARRHRRLWAGNTRVEHLPLPP